MYEILHCKKCNEVVSDQEKYCINCGTKIEKVHRCPQCSKPMIEMCYTYECEECGVVMSKR